MPITRLPTKGDPKELARFTAERWEALKPEYDYWRRFWRRTLDFIQGLHWRALAEMDLKQIPAWRRFPSLGYTLPIYIDELASWLQSKVRFSAIPRSPDPKDIAAAEIGEGALAYAWSIMGIEEKKLDLGAWLAITGNAALRTFWNTDTGNLVPVGVTNENGQFVPVDPETGEPLPPGVPPVSVDAGELDADVLNPYLVRWPRSRRDGVMIGMELTEDEVAALFGEEWVDKLDFSRVSPDKLSLEVVSSINKDTRVAFLVEHQIPRSKSLPQGLWWVVDISREVIVAGPNPLPGGAVSVTPFRWVPQPGSKVGLSPLYQITFSNKLMDELVGKAMEWVGKVVPIVALKDGGGVEPNQITDEPFQQIMTYEGGAPEILMPPELPKYFYELRNISRQDIEFAGGYALASVDELVPGSASQSMRKPTRVRRSSKGPAIELMEIASKPAWKHFGRTVLGFIRELYDESRIFGIVGKDRLYQWVEFTSTDLERLPMDVDVDEVALYSFNRQNVRDTVVALLSSPAGQVLFGDVTPDGQFTIDKDRVETALQSVGIDAGIAELDPDIAEARNEHAFIRLNMLDRVAVEPHQNHPAHSSEHGKFMKSITFKAWPEEAKNFLRQHTGQHQQVMDEAAQAEAQGMLQQEKAMREIREATEMQADVRRELANAIIDGLRTYIETLIVQLVGTREEEHGTKEKAR